MQHKRHSSTDSSDILDLPRGRLCLHGSVESHSKHCRNVAHAALSRPNVHVFLPQQGKTRKHHRNRNWNGHRNRTKQKKKANANGGRSSLLDDSPTGDDGNSTSKHYQFTPTEVRFGGKEMSEMALSDIQCGESHTLFLAGSDGSGIM